MRGCIRGCVKSECVEEEYQKVCIKRGYVRGYGYG